MAYQIKYSFGFYGLVGNEHFECLLLRKDYTGAAIALNCIEGSGIEITTRKSDIDNVGAGIYGKDADFSLYFDNNFDIEEFFLEDQKAWQIVVNRNGGEYFRGWLNTNLSQRPFSYTPFVFKISATDGLADLKNKLVLNYAEKVATNYRTPVEMLVYLLSKTGIVLPLKTVFTLGHQLVSGNMLHQHKIDPLRFVNGFEPMSIYDAIGLLCKTYRCKLIQSRGAWWFVFIGSLTQTTAITYNYVDNGTFLALTETSATIGLQSVINVGPRSDFNTIDSENIFIDTAFERYERSVKRKKYKFEYGSPKNLLWDRYLDGIRYKLGYWSNGIAVGAILPMPMFSLISDDGYTNLNSIRINRAGIKDTIPTFLPSSNIQVSGLPQRYAKDYVLFDGVSVTDLDEITISVTIKNRYCAGGRIMVYLAEETYTNLPYLGKFQSMSSGGQWVAVGESAENTNQTIVIENAHKETTGLLGTDIVEVANEDEFTFSVKSAQTKVNGKVYLYLLPAVSFERDVCIEGTFADITVEQYGYIIPDAIVHFSDGTSWRYNSGDKLLQSSYSIYGVVSYCEYSKMSITKSRKGSLNEKDYEELSIESISNIDGVIEESESVISFGEAGNDNNHAKLYNVDLTELGALWRNPTHNTDIYSFKKLSCLEDFTLTDKVQKVVEGTIRGNSFDLPFGFSINKARFEGVRFQVLESKENLFRGETTIMLSSVNGVVPSVRYISNNNFGGSGSGSVTVNGSGAVAIDPANELVYRSGAALTAGMLVMADLVLGSLIPFEPLHENAGRLIGMVRNGDYPVGTFVDVAKSGDRILFPPSLLSHTLGVTYWAGAGGTITRDFPVQNATGNALSQIVGKTTKGALFNYLEMNIGEPHKIK